MLRKFGTFDIVWYHPNTFFMCYWYNWGRKMIYCVAKCIYCCHTFPWIFYIFSPCKEIKIDHFLPSRPIHESLFLSHFGLNFDKTRKQICQTDEFVNETRVDVLLRWKNISLRNEKPLLLSVYHCSVFIPYWKLLIHKTIPSKRLFFKSLVVIFLIVL